MRIEVPPPSGLAGFGLRQLERLDVPDWYAYLSLPGVIEHTSWNLAGLKDLEALCGSYESPTPDSPSRLAVVENKGNRLIGTIGFHTVCALNRTAEIAFDFAPAYWGLGIATAMCNTVTQWSFAAFGLVRVQATVLDTNRASERVLQKCGFVYEGLLRSYRMVRGRPGNFKMYSRLADMTE
ncbi:MAG TPA: GNAT family protein [Steroidobacteraceae bacterium]|jgi:RimJ/RimL family protein N-acetyltransferase|nr:GNAT family protein [Steroidobacteraceae bacterium]